MQVRETLNTIAEGLGLVRCARCGTSLRHVSAARRLAFAEQHGSLQCWDCDPHLDLVVRMSEPPHTSPREDSSPTCIEPGCRRAVHAHGWPCARHSAGSVHKQPTNQPNQ